MTLGFRTEAYWLAQQTWYKAHVEPRSFFSYAGSLLLLSILPICALLSALLSLLVLMVLKPSCFCSFHMYTPSKPSAHTHLSKNCSLPFFHCFYFLFLFLCFPNLFCHSLIGICTPAMNRYKVINCHEITKPANKVEDFKQQVPTDFLSFFHVYNKM